MRKFIRLEDLHPDFEALLFSWASLRKVACILKSNTGFNHVDEYSAFESCIAVDALEQLEGVSPAFESLKKFHQDKKDWLFGYLTYDLKNETGKSNSSNFDGLRFPSLHFFQPRIIFLKKKGAWSLGYHTDADTELSAKEVMANIGKSEPQMRETGAEVSICQRVSREQYLSDVAGIRAHIQRGDIYEMNYCVEFYATNAKIHTAAVYEMLNEISPMPFSCFYKNGGQHLLCASPERFIARRANKIISQPVKGTAKRGRNREEDERIREHLFNDEKERSENVMIVDLVRNDLSRTAARGSVKVAELFGIYTFRQLHQMISTVVSEMRPDVHWTEVIRHAFPMGSMTGAPKIRAMELIEKFESTKRGLYSGAAGYVTPEGDFDFNVVIRSILYNSVSGYLSFMVGSAITINSDGEKEYEECLLKSKAMVEVLSGKNLESVS